MLYKLLRLFLTKPHLLADHAHAYAALASVEIEAASARYQRRLWLGAAALCSLGAAVVLAGVAVMLWAVTPDENIRSLWAVIGAPLLPLLVGLYCMFRVRERSPVGLFETLLHQVRTDLDVLGKVSPL
jgi:uncharacterized membrane protein YqjE